MPDEFSEFLAKQKKTPDVDSQRKAIESGASALGIDPVDYATAMSYETGGTLDPWQKGPVTKWGQHRGTIQYGEPQRKQYGVYQGQPFEDQVTTSNVKYLKDAGVKPGATFDQIYTAINGGKVGKNPRTPDANTGRTIADNIRNADVGHRDKVLQRFWGGQKPADEFAQFTSNAAPDEFAQFVTKVYGPNAGEAPEPAQPVANPDNPVGYNGKPTLSPDDVPPVTQLPVDTSTMKDGVIRMDTGQPDVADARQQVASYADNPQYMPIANPEAVASPESSRFAPQQVMPSHHAVGNATPTQNVARATSPNGANVMDAAVTQQYADDARNAEAEATRQQQAEAQDSDYDKSTQAQLRQKAGLTPLVETPRGIGSPTDDLNRVAKVVYSTKENPRDAAIEALVHSDYEITPQEAAKYVDSLPTPLQDKNHKVGQGIQVTFNDIAKIKGADAVKEIIRSEQAQSRTDSDAPDLRPVPIPSAVPSPQELAQKVKDITKVPMFGYSDAPSGLFGGLAQNVGDLSGIMAGLMKASPVYGAVNEIVSNGGTRPVKAHDVTADDLMQFYHDASAFNEATGAKDAKGKDTIPTILIKGAGQVPEYAVMGMLPGGLITGIAIKNAALARAEDKPWPEVMKQLGWGAVEGGLFQFLPKSVQKVFGADTSALKQIGRIGAEVAGISGGIYGLETLKNPNASPEDKLQGAIAIGLFHLYGATKGALKGEVAHVVDAENDLEAYVKVEGPDKFVFVEKQKPNFEMAIPKPDAPLDKKYASEKPDVKAEGKQADIEAAKSDAKVNLESGKNSLTPESKLSPPKPANTAAKDMSTPSTNEPDVSIKGKNVSIEDKLVDNAVEPDKTGDVDVEKPVEKVDEAKPRSTPRPEIQALGERLFKPSEAEKEPINATPENGKTYAEYQKEIDAYEDKLEAEGVNTSKLSTYGEKVENYPKGYTEEPKALAELYAKRDAIDKAEVESNVKEIDKQFEPLISDATERNKFVRRISQADLPTALRDENRRGGGSKQANAVGKLTNEVMHYVSENVTNDIAQTTFAIKANVGGTADDPQIELHILSEKGLGPSRATLNETQRWFDHLYGDGAVKIPGAKQVAKLEAKPSSVAAKRQQLTERKQAMADVKANKLAKAVPVSKAEQVETEPVEKSELAPDLKPFEKNTIVPADRVAEIRKQIEAKTKGVMASGVDPEIYKLYVELGVAHVESGLRKFADWSKQMKTELGESAAKHLEAIWNTIQVTHKDAPFASEMDEPPSNGKSATEGQPEPRPSSIMHAEIDADRENRGWAKLSPRIRQSNPDLHAEVKDIIDKDPDAPRKTYEKYKYNPKSVPNTVDGVLLNAHLIDTKIAVREATKGFTDAMDKDDPLSVADAKMSLSVANANLDDAQKVAWKGGSERGAALQSQKMFATEDFEYTNLFQSFKAAKGREPNDVEIKELQRIADEHKAKSEELETILAGKEDEIAHIKSQLPPKHILDIAENYVKKLDALVNKERERLKTRGAVFQSGIDPRDLKSAAIIGAGHLAHMSLDFAKWSDKMVDEFGDKVKPHLEKLFDDAQKVLKGGHAALKGDADKMATALKTQKTRMENRIKELENAIMKRERITRNRPTLKTDTELDNLRERVKSLKSDYDELFPVDRSTSDAQRLKNLEKRLEKKQKAISDKVNTNDLSDSPKRTPINPWDIKQDNSGKYTKEDKERATRVLKAQAEVGRIEKRYQRMKDEAERKAEPVGKWIQRKAVNYVKASMLSAVTVVEKLGASSIMRPVTGAIKTGIGVPVGWVMPEISRMAAIEGSKGLKNDISTQAYALAKGYTTGVMDMGRTLKQTVDINDAHGSHERYYTSGKYLPFEVSQGFGLMHDALKAPAFRYAYESNLGNLILDAKLKGHELDPETMWLLGQQAYQYAKRVKFQEANPLNSFITKTMKSLDEGKVTHIQAIDQILGTMFHITLPIHSISTNVVAQSLLESSPIGLTRGLTRASILGVKRAKAKVTGQDFTMKDHLTPEQADIIVRNIKSGFLGSAMYAVGLFAGLAAVGSFYRKYDKDKDKGVAKYNTIQIGGTRIPAPLLHIPEFNNLFMGSTTNRVYLENLKDNSPAQAAFRGVGAGVAGMAEETPGLDAADALINIWHAIMGGSEEQMGESRYGVGNFVAGRVVPGLVRNVAEINDQDPEGHYVYPFVKEPFHRKTNQKTFGESIKTQAQKSIPWWRNELPNDTPTSDQKDGPEKKTAEEIREERIKRREKEVEKRKQQAAAR